VFRSEPAGDSGRFRSRLCDLPGVIGTQHIGAITEQARQATADEVVRIVQAFVVSGEALNCLNLCERSPATWQLVLRVRDQVGVMAAILEAIRADGINAQEISSRVFTGVKAAWCTIALDERPSTEALSSIRALPQVLHLELRAVV
jgi:D-3-phosphoglycerate dehydrogenase / 2-oxoglutarate reductase